MIEAVNSVLSNTSLTRGVASQQSTSRSLSANPERVQETAVQAPYVSPYISVDSQSNKAVLQIRDSDTGDVVRQFPTEGQLKAYRTAQEFVDRAEQLRSEDSNTPALSNAPAPQAEPVEAPQAPITQAQAVSTEA